MRHADDDHVADDERGRVQTHLTGVEIDFLIGLELQIDRAVLAERGDRDASPGVERLQPVSGRDVDDSSIGTVCGRPVRNAASGAGANRVLTADALVLGVHPQHLSARRVQRDDGAPHGGHRVHHAIDEEWCGGVKRIGTRPEEVGLEPPGDLELAEIVFGDLVRGRVAMAREVRAVGGPVGALPSRASSLRIRIRTADAEEKCGCRREGQDTCQSWKHRGNLAEASRKPVFSVLLLTPFAESGCGFLVSRLPL